MMIKILYIVSRLSRVGPINQLYYIVSNLDIDKIKPCILTLKPENNNSMYRDFKDIGIEVHTIECSFVKSILFENLKLKNKVRQIAPNMIHSFGLNADFQASRVNINQISTIHNYPYDDYPDKYSYIKGVIIAFLHLQITRKIKNTVACSHIIYQMYKERANIKLLTYIQNGVDTTKFHPVDSDTKIQLRYKLNLHKDKKIFISVGNLIGRKDPKTIIKAFIERDKRDELIIFLGKGELQKKCEAMSKEFDNIVFLREKNNVKEYLQASDYFISASHAEGLPNSVLEAMSCGLPCILSDIGPHKEILGHNKNIDFSFPTKNIDMLNQKIDAILKSNYNEMSNTCAKLIIENFSSEKMSLRYRELYEKIVVD